MKRGDKMTTDRSGSDRSTIMAAVEIIFGIIIFTSAWWLPEGSRQTGLYVFGFITVLLGIITAVVLTSKR